jgi:hypothetical protein
LYRTSNVDNAKQHNYREEPITKWTTPKHLLTQIWALITMKTQSMWQHIKASFPEHSCNQYREISVCWLFKSVVYQRPRQLADSGNIISDCYHFLSQARKEKAGQWADHESVSTYTTNPIINKLSHLYTYFQDTRSKTLNTTLNLKKKEMNCPWLEQMCNSVMIFS